MRKNITKSKIKHGEPVIGVISAVSEPIIAEMLGLAGFDFYMADAEHGPISPSQAAHIARACESAGVTPLVRVGQKDAKRVLQYLDVGVMGVMMPGLETPEEIEMLVSAVKYQPFGKRGIAYVRAGDYMLGADSLHEYVTRANEETMVIPQFEDVTLLDRLPVMAAIPGVDGFVIGPADLSMSMGFTDGPGHPEVQAIIDQAIGIIRDAGLFVGITAANGQAAQAQIERGAHFIIAMLPDLIGRSSRAYLAEARQTPKE